jgi:hypothetical protein
VARKPPADGRIRDQKIEISGAGLIGQAMAKIALRAG